MGLVGRKMIPFKIISKRQMVMIMVGRGQTGRDTGRKESFFTILYFFLNCVNILSIHDCLNKVK